MSTGSAERPVAKPQGTAHRVRLIIFRVVAVLAGLFFVVAVVLMASAPWVLLQPDQEVKYRTESLVPHRRRQRRRDHCRCTVRPRVSTAADTVGRRTGRGSRCGWRDHPSLPAHVRSHPRSRRGPAGCLPVLARRWEVSIMVGRRVAAAAHPCRLAGAALLVTAAVALPRQIGGTEPAAHAGWWSDYAEHATVLALAGVLAARRGPGCRILRGMCSAVWLYLGLVAALVLPRHSGSWDRIGGAVAFLVGVGFGVAAWRGSEREVTGSPRRAPP